MRSPWMPEAEALADLEQAAADAQAWQECLQAYLAAARDGSREVRGRRAPLLRQGRSLQSNEDHDRNRHRQVQIATTVMS